MDCTYEEQIDIPLTQMRWYEQPAGTALWYLSAEPLQPSAYEPIFTVKPDLTTDKDSYTQLWGRGQEINSIIGVFYLLLVFEMSYFRIII
jgi:hypothetical protein